MKLNFKSGNIIYGLSIDTTPALIELASIGLEQRENGKDNILVQSALTNTVFGPIPTPGEWRTDMDIGRDLNDQQRGIDFKNLSIHSSLFSGIDWENESPEQLVNKLWGRTRACCGKVGTGFPITTCA